MDNKYENKKNKYYQNNCDNIYFKNNNKINNSNNKKNNDSSSPLNSLFEVEHFLCNFQKATKCINFIKLFK